MKYRETFYEYVRHMALTPAAALETMNTLQI